MKLLTILGVFTVMITLLTALVFAETVIDDTKNPGYLFVISGTSGSLDGDNLTLNGVPNVVYFSDRPAKVAGHISLEKFVGMWDKGVDNFKTDPPNAELSIYEKEGDKHSVLIISSPEVKGETISFKVKLLTPNEPIPNSFTHSALFIDSGVTNNNNQGPIL